MRLAVAGAYSHAGWTAALGGASKPLHGVWAKAGGDGIVWDITENKQVELELADSRARLRELAAHLESVREEEKARIAREVHDELGQVLTVLKLETAMCELALPAALKGWMSAWTA